MKSMRPILSNNYKKDAKKILVGLFHGKKRYVSKYKNPYQR